MHNLREIQIFELNMLKDIANICEENDIRYFISSGTLLGAVRHGGFIPWDDDIDIIMPLSDYKKFIKIGQKLLNDAYGDKYFVQNYKSEKNYCEMWTQIRVNNTTSMPVKLKKQDIHWGMCMDVFPLVGYSSNNKVFEKQKKALAFNRMLLNDLHLRAVNTPLTLKQKLISIIPRGIRREICKINEHNFMLDPEKHEYSVIVWWNLPIRYPSGLFSERIKIKFEDGEFYTVKDYDKYLTCVYGDYMTPPNEEDRGGHDLTLGTIIMDLENDYTTYK